MSCESGYSNGNTATDGTELNLSVLLNYGKILLLVVKVHHLDASVPKSWATENIKTNQQVGQALQLKWSCLSSESELATQGRVETNRWAQRRVGLTVLHRPCISVKCAAIKQAKHLKPLWYG